MRVEDVYVFVFVLVVFLTRYLQGDVSADTEQLLTDQVHQLDTGAFQLHDLSFGHHVKSSVRRKQANSHSCGANENKTCGLVSGLRCEGHQTEQINY